MGYQTILFDLDGTLTDPKLGITTAAATALAHFGIHEDPDNLTWMIGPPLQGAFQDHFGFPPEQAEEAVRQFRLYYNDRGWAENVPYPGIRQMLHRLQQSGKTLIVATSKPEATAVRVLKYFDMASYFDLICGAPPSPPEASKKACVIRNALARMNIASLKGVVMVGDRRHDVEGAHEVGIPAVGVLYGYGSFEELQCCGADAITETVQSLSTLLQ